MSFIDCVCSWGKKLVNKVKEVVTHPVETAKKVWAGAKNFAKSTYENVSGEKAKRIVEEAKAKLEQEQEAFKRRMDYCRQEGMVLQTSLEQLSQSINQKKEYIVNVLYVRMKKVLSKIKYEKRFAREYVTNFELKLDLQLRLKEELFSIDFAASPITSRLKAIFTLGFWANKQAKESAARVKEEVMKMQDHAQRTEAEVKRWSLIKQALGQTEKFLAKMIEVYEGIILKAEDCANLLRMKCLQFTHQLSEAYCNIGALPKADQELLYALFNMSKIMDTVIKTQFLSNEKLATAQAGEVQAYQAQLREEEQGFDQVCRTIAA